MKKISLNLTALAVAVALSGNAFYSYAYPTLDVGDNTKAPLHTKQSNEVKKRLEDRIFKTGGVKALSEEKVVVDMAFYMHPFYLDQSYISTRFDSSTKENGGQFAIERIKGFVEEINTGLAESGINAEVNLKFVYKMADVVPILSSSGSSSFTMPDGVTVVNKDSEFFELLMQDWGDDLTRYGYTRNGGTRRLRDASQADIHVYIRPHMNEPIIQDGFATPLIETYPNISRPLFDSALGDAFEFGTMTIYDFYWQLGYQNIDPTINFIKKIATNKIGALLGAGDENGNPNGASYAKAATCGSGKTVMSSNISTSTLSFFSNPNIFFEGQPCGTAIGQANEADNSSVVRENITLVSAAAESENVTSTFRLIQPESFLTDGLNLGVQVVREGDLTKPGYVTLYAVGSSATEGNRDRRDGTIPAEADFHFGVQTIEFAPGQEVNVATIYSNNRVDTYDIEQFSIVADFSINGTIDPESKSVNIAILPNAERDDSEDEVSFALETSTVVEGSSIDIPIQRTLNGDYDIELVLSATSANAESGVNYELVTETLTLGRAEEFGYARLNIIDDGKYEKGQSINLAITSENAIVVTPSLKLDIEEVSSPNIGIAKSKVETIVLDNLAGSATVRLERYNGTDESHTFRLLNRSSSTLDENTDFSFGEAFTFGHRDSEGSINVTFNGKKLGKIDYDIYSDELQTVTGSGTIIVQKSLSLPKMEISLDVTTNENSASAPIILNREDASAPLLVGVTYVNSTALSGIDYSDEIKEVYFDIGEKSITLNIPIIDRPETGSDRVFSVVFNSDEVTMPNNTTTVTIKDVVRNDNGGGDGGGDGGAGGGDSNNGKIDNYTAGSVGVMSLLLLPLIWLRRKTYFKRYFKR
jgi:hypothetical protein